MALSVPAPGNTRRRSSNPVTVFREVRTTYLAVALVSFVINLLMLTGPLFMLQIYDRVIASGSVSTLLALAGIAFVLYVFFGLLDHLRARILTRLGTHLDASLAESVFNAQARLPLLNQGGSKHMDPVRDLDKVRQFFLSPGPAALFDMPWMPVYIAVVYLFHPVLGLAALFGAFIMCMLIGFNEILTRQPLRTAAAEGAKRRGLANRTRQNAEVVAAMGMMRGLTALWQKQSREFLRRQTEAQDITAFFNSFIKTFRFMLQSAVLGIGAYLAIKGDITPGIMIAASILTARGVAPIEQAIGQWRGFINARDGLARLKTALKATAIPSPHTQLPLPKSHFQIDHGYVVAPGSQSLLVHDVSFTLKSGEALGIIGPSGSGKSSLGRALTGVWPLTKGAVRLDGAEISQWQPERLGAAVGYLPQDVQLFSGTVAENIARFHPHLQSEKVIQAAQHAHAHDLIKQLPQGYDTEIGENGAILSGGQKQRIALARAFYGDPFLLVLDEPNSNLDADGEMALTLALRAARDRGCIVIVIAHRPSAISVVDSLLFLRQGQVGVLGARDDVLKKVLSPDARKSTGILSMSSA